MSSYGKFGKLFVLHFTSLYSKLLVEEQLLKNVKVQIIAFNNKAVQAWEKPMLIGELKYFNFYLI